MATDLAERIHSWRGISSIRWRESVLGEAYHPFGGGNPFLARHIIHLAERICTWRGISSIWRRESVLGEAYHPFGGENPYLARHIIHLAERIRSWRGISSIWRGESARSEAYHPHQSSVVTSHQSPNHSFGHEPGPHGSVWAQTWPE